MGIFTEEERGFAESLIDEIRDEFNKDLLVIKDGEKIAISEDLSYNYIYGRNNQGEKSYEETPQTIVVKGSILYGSPEQDTWSAPNSKSQFRIKLPSNTVRVRVNQEGYDIMKEAKRVEIEGKRYSFSTDFRPHGLFRSRFYDFFLQVIDEED